jgi:hypothetical protein
MTRAASLIAIFGILTAVICLPLAAALHRDAIGSSDWDWSEFGNWGDDDEDVPAGNVVSRDFSWGEADRLELQVPAAVHFVPAPAWHLSIRGSERTLDRLWVSDGRIGVRDSGLFHGHHLGHLEVQLAGPALRDAAINGSGTLTLDNLKQDTLNIHIRGSGTARANGSVEALNIEISGSGSARLEHLATSSATVRIAGSGDADIAPTEDADVYIAGSGDVRLHSHPKHLRSQVHGSGKVTETPEEQTGAASQPTIALARAIANAIDALQPGHTRRVSPDLEN